MKSSRGRRHCSPRLLVRGPRFRVPWVHTGWVLRYPAAHIADYVAFFLLYHGIRRWLAAEARARSVRLLHPAGASPGASAIRKLSTWRHSPRLGLWCRWSCTTIGSMAMTLGLSPQGTRYSILGWRSRLRIASNS